MREYQEIMEAFPWLAPLCFFLFGACVGSFLNVCILRVPKGRSIMRPPSSCACGRQIAWYDNIPVLSWFVLRGKARCCGAKFSIRYPLIELFTALIFLGMCLLFPMPKALCGCAFAFIMIMATFIDMDTLHLPDALTVGGTLVGLLLSALVPDLHDAQIAGFPYFFSCVKSFLISITGVAVGSGLLYWMRLLGEWVFKREAMGEGDVVLIGCIGAFCGWQGAFFAIFGGSLIGTFLLVPILLISKLLPKKKADKKAKKQSGEEDECDAAMIPFGPWLCLGGLLYFMFFDVYVDAYLGGFIESVFFAQ